MNELLKIKKFNQYLISHARLDDISVKIIESLMNKKGTKNLPELLPRYQNIIRPFYLISKKEIELYKKLKKIKITNRAMKQTAQIKKTNKEINSWLNSLEQKHPEIKNSIVSSLLKISPTLN